MNSPYVAFRVDGGAELGIGHIMRCLTLADRANKMGFKILFICASLESSLKNKITNKGFKLSVIESDMEKDAKHCLEIIDDYLIKLLIVDHYKISNEWERQLKKSVDEMVVIDDLADRPHDCDFLIDSAYGRTKSEYEKLVNSECQLLLSSDYTILRPDFIGSRPQAFNKRRETHHIKKVLINFGGTDILDLSILSMEQLLGNGFTGSIDILISSSYTKLADLKNTCKSLTNVTLHIDSNQVAEIMLQADLAIGSLGTSTWERCCLGLPCISVVVADNQSYIAQQLAEYGAIELTSIQKMEQTIVNYMDVSHMRYWKIQSEKSFTLCDGNGADRILSKLFSNECDSNNVLLAPASTLDEELLFSWQTEAGNRKFSRISKIPSRIEHNAWFEASLANSKRRMWLVLYQGVKCGYVRLDDLGESEEVSVLIGKDHQGLGVAFKSINILKRLSLYNNIKAEVAKENLASIRLFKSLDFIQLSPIQYRWEKS